MIGKVGVVGIWGGGGVWSVEFVGFGVWYSLTFIPYYEAASMAREGGEWVGSVNASRLFFSRRLPTLNQRMLLQDC